MIFKLKFEMETCKKGNIYVLWHIKNGAGNARTKTVLEDDTEIFQEFGNANNESQLRRAGATYGG